MEQLQQTLNEAIKMWWQKEMIGDLWISCDEWWLYVAILWYVFTYHDLFSKDSLLMEFMKWKDYGYWDTQSWLVWWWDYPWHEYLTRLDSAYRDMWPMTAQEKIDYFNKNAYL